MAEAAIKAAFIVSKIEANVHHINGNINEGIAMSSISSSAHCVSVPCIVMVTLRVYNVQGEGLLSTDISRREIVSA